MSGGGRRAAAGDAALRVLLVTGSFPPMACGVGDYTRGLARALAGVPGLEVGVLTSTQAGEGDPGVEVFPVVRAWHDGEFAAVREVLRAFAPDVVHVQFPTQGYTGTLPWHLPALLRMRRLPVVQTWHEYFLTEGSPLALARATWRDLPIVAFGRDVVVVRPEFERRLPWWFRPLTAGKRFHLIPNAPTLPRVALDAAERREVRARWGAGDKAMLAFFGFCYEHKGIDDALAAMDPTHHHLVVVGGLDPREPYHAGLLRRFAEPPLAGHVTTTGFLDALEAARVLAAADAVVLPFRRGGGSWNTSIKAAALQGTFVLTTSTERTGYDPVTNVYYAPPNDPAGLAEGLTGYLGRRLEHPTHELAGPSWPEIAQRHLEIYRSNV